MRFEWDESKETANIQKHGVLFLEAIEVLENPLSYSVYDDDHSDTEHRFITIGFTVANRLLVVCHTDRNDVLRIISARSASRRERKDYEDGTYTA